MLRFSRSLILKEEFSFHSLWWVLACDLIKLVMTLTKSWRFHKDNLRHHPRFPLISLAYNRFSLCLVLLLSYEIICATSLIGLHYFHILSLSVSYLSLSSNSISLYQTYRFSHLFNLNLYFSLFQKFVILFFIVVVLHFYNFLLF